MKALIFTSLILCITGCHTNSNAKLEDIKSTSSHTSDSLYYLNNLLQYTSHDKVVKAFGITNVVKDSGMVEGGEMSYTTRIFPNSFKEVVFEWNPMKPFNELQKVTQYLNYGRYGETAKEFALDNPYWKTRQGIYLGMPKAEVEKINNSPFVFWGFEWDNDGFIIDYLNGNLKDDNIIIRLGYNLVDTKATENFYNQFTGDVEIKSNNPNLKIVDLFVQSISLRATIVQ